MGSHGKGASLQKRRQPETIFNVGPGSPDKPTDGHNDLPINPELAKTQSGTKSQDSLFLVRQQPVTRIDHASRLNCNGFRQPAPSADNPLAAADLSGSTLMFPG
jgi:hypothetical protein